MSVTYMTTVPDRMEFRKARMESGLTAHDVDRGAGWALGTCGNFELDHRPLSVYDEEKLLHFLQVIAAEDCKPKRDYRASILEYREKHGLARKAFARIAELPESVVRALESGRIKHRPLAKTREKLDAVLFDA